MKRSILVLTVLVLSLVCVRGVIGFSRASIENQASYTVVDPENALVAFVPTSNLISVQ